MVSPLYVLKLGGSIVTRKSENVPSIHLSRLEPIIRDIALAKKKKDFDLIVVSGVGSIGHGLVVKWGIKDGVFTPKQKKGNALCLRATKKIGGTIVRLLKKYGVKSSFVDASSFFVQKNKKIIKSNLSAYEKLLSKGIVPVSTGSMVPDKKLNWSVMSGDRIISRVSSNLHPSFVLLGTDVDGIFEEDPKLNPKAKRIRLITKKNVARVLSRVGESRSVVDVTKGMKGKLEEVSKMGDRSPVKIFSLLKKNALRKVLLRPSLNIGTTVRLD